MDRRARTALIGARSLLRNGWCQGALARKSNGAPVDPGSDLARSWSLLGAIDGASEEIGEPSTQAVCEASRALSPADPEDAWSPSEAKRRRALLRALNDGPGATKQSPRQRIGRTTTEAHLQVRCASGGKLKVGLALDSTLYPLSGREGALVVRWDGPEGEEVTPVSYWGKLIDIPAPGRKRMLDRLARAKEVWLGLKGKTGENLIWATSLKGSGEAITTARRHCAAGRDTFRDPPREKRATGRTTGGGCSYGDVHAAWAYAQRAVMAEMRSPGSADFPFGGSRHLNYAGGCTWTGTSWVEGQNAYGGNVRDHYTVTVTLLPGHRGQASVRWH